MLQDLIILILLIVAVAFFSAAEFAFVITNKIKIEIKAIKKSIPALNSLYFYEHPQVFFTTVLVGSTFSLILLSSLSAISLINMFAFNLTTILLISSLIIITAGKMLPKYFVTEKSEVIILAASTPIRLLFFLFYPLIKIISSVSGPLVKSYEIKEDTLNYMFNKGEIEKTS